MTNVNDILVAKPEWKRLLGRLKRIWKSEGNWVGDVDWIHLDQDRYQWSAVMNTIMALRIL
jgi:hypothetical protein